MYSAVQIANMALGHVRGKRISSFENPQTEEEIWCSVYWNIAVDEVLRRYPWNCALARQSLTRLTAPPVTVDYQYQYQLPQSPYCLRVLCIPDAPDAKYKIEGRRLLTNEPAVTILYISRLTDPAAFDPDLAVAVSLRLASFLAIPIANSQERANALAIMYENYMKRIEAQEAEESTGPETTDFEAVHAGD